MWSTEDPGAGGPVVAVAAVVLGHQCRRQRRRQGRRLGWLLRGRGGRLLLRLAARRCLPGGRQFFASLGLVGILLLRVSALPDSEPIDQTRSDVLQQGEALPIPGADGGVVRDVLPTRLGRNCRIM